MTSYRKELSQNRLAFRNVAKFSQKNLSQAIAVRVSRRSSSIISSVKRRRCFIPAVLRRVRIAFAVRPRRPITLPKSFG